jgi:hypothetical protein
LRALQTRNEPRVLCRYNGVGPSKTLHDEYGDTTQAHNTLTLDGKQQQAAPSLATKPLPNSSWRFGAEEDVVRASMSLWDGLEGNATHTRALLYRRAPSAGMPPYVVVVRLIAL